MNIHAKSWFLQNNQSILNPNFFGSLLHHYDFSSDQNTIISNEFNQLVDLKHGLTLNANSSTQRPAKITLNNKNAGNFIVASGSGRQMQRLSSENFFNNQGELHFYMLVKSRETANDEIPITIRKDGVRRFEINFVRSSSPNALVRVRGITSGSSETIANSTTNTVNEWFILTVKLDLVNQNIKIFKNGSNIADTAFSTPDTAFENANINFYRFGGNGSFGPLDGSVAEMLFYTNSNQKKVENYLIKKWLPTALRDGSGDLILDSNLDLTF